ncbi:hypothetical protein ACFWNK_19665 [Streptomyces sp. NPDC058417]|uniref:hypothetical protein n=1 Tax=unclassified Streptomyces TaxID=2593676 RepID=UPI003650AE74
MTSVRHYLVLHSAPLFGSRRFTFTSTAPAGSVVEVTLAGRTVRALLTDAPVHGRFRIAERQDTFL